MSRRSRLYRNLEKESKKNFALSILGIFLILFLLFKFGLPLLANFSLLISNSKQSIPNKNSTEYIIPPILDPLPSATNSAKFKLSGKAEANASLDFYLNNSLVDKTLANKNGEFSFDSEYTKGENKIYVLAKIDNKTSNPSETIVILYKDSKPSLNISSPSDGQQFSKDQNEINISGSTDANVKITVNGFWAIVDQSNSFNYKLKLSDGENVIKVVAEDQAGNKTEKEIKVKYSST